MGRRAEQQRSLRPEHAAQFREPRASVGHVLDHLSRPNDVESRVRQRPLPFRLDQAQIESRPPAACPAQRLLRDVGAHHPATGVGKRGSKPALATTEIEQPLARRDPLAQICEAQRRESGLQAFGQVLPKAFVMVPQGHRSAHATSRSRVAGFRSEREPLRRDCIECSEGTIVRVCFSQP